LLSFFGESKMRARVGFPHIDRLITGFLLPSDPVGFLRAGGVLPPTFEGDSSIWMRFYQFWCVAGFLFAQRR
jgi:hypothetical protein